MANDFHALSAWLGDLGNGVGARMGVATQKTVQDTVNLSRSMAPVDTGNLRASIHGSTQVGPTRVLGEVTAGAHYAVYVEQGTSRMAPQPFMRPAQEATTPAWLQAIAQAGGTPR
jgi:HK97 gp10 family phage protein